MSDVVPENPHAAPTLYSESQPEAQEGAADMGESVDSWDVDLEYLDAVARASALSFPASDPPALSGPDRGSAVARDQQHGRGVA
jgi:hypothetical protein